MIQILTDIRVPYRILASYKKASFQCQEFQRILQPSETMEEPRLTNQPGLHCWTEPGSNPDLIQVWAVNLPEITVQTNSGNRAQGVSFSP